MTDYGAGDHVDTGATGSRNPLLYLRESERIARLFAQVRWTERLCVCVTANAPAN